MEQKACHPPRRVVSSPTRERCSVRWCRVDAAFCIRRSNCLRRLQSRRNTAEHAACISARQGEPVMRGLGWASRVAMTVISLLAGAAQAQVDWSDVLSGKPPEPVVEAPPPQEAPAPPAPPPVQRRASTQESARARSKSASATRAAPPRARRRVARRDPEDDREYPAVPNGRRR